MRRGESGCRLMYEIEMMEPAAERKNRYENAVVWKTTSTVDASILSLSE